MFNLFISGDSNAWDSSPYKYDRSRAVVEYTADEISVRYKSFDESAINELKSFPALFVTERETTESMIGYITNIRRHSSSVSIEFEIDKNLPLLPIGAIEAMREDIDLGPLELCRTHWAVKDVPIVDILLHHKYLNQQQIEASQKLRIQDPPVVPQVTGEVFNNSQVFIVHGHDEIAKIEVVKFVEDLGLEPIILHMQANSGRTIIEKIEDYSNVGFAIVIYTPCDTGQKTGNLNARYRARQNVVFEHGYLIGKLERSRVMAVVKGDVEIPNDISGVVYIPMGSDDKWQEQLKLEMRTVGFQV